MNFKKAALTAVAALATTAGGAQAGYMVDGYRVMEASDFTGPQARIVRALDALNVPVIDGGATNMDACAPLENGAYRLGFYVPSHNVMVLCTNNGDAAQMDQTLTHESVHVIQDIRAGLHNGEIVTNDHEIEYFATHLPQDQVNIIVSLYDESQWDAEIEARALQDNPLMVADKLEDEAEMEGFRNGHVFRF